MPRASTRTHATPSRMPRVRGAVRRAAVVALLLAALLAVTLPTGAQAINFSAGQNADRLLGGPNYTSPTYHSSANMEYGTYQPHGVAIDGSGSVYVADTSSDRLMRWAATPASDGAGMTNVVQKASGSHWSFLNTCSGGAQAPEQLSATGDGATLRMTVTDRYNHRVVIHTTEPTTEGATGSIFLGQANGSSCSPNRGNAAPDATTLQSPTSAWTNGTYVAVADTDNNRVLLWDSFPASGAAASRVLGQADFDDFLPDRGDGTLPGADTLHTPKGVWFDGTFLYVADAGNDRVLVWNGWPTTDGEAADYVIGFNNFTSDVGGCNNQRLNYPAAVTTFGTGAGHRLAIVTENSHRVVVLNGWQAAPTSYPTFNTVLGQTNLSSCGPNRNGSSAAANSLRGPSGVSFDTGGALWVADTENHRVLRFPSLATNTAADRVIGHPDATSSTPMDGTDDNVFKVSVGSSNAGTFGTRLAVGSDGSLVAVDPNDSTARIWTGGAAADNEIFDFRTGQPARQHAGYNGPGDAASASTFNEPKGAWTDGTRMLVADNFNDRVLVWTTMPTSDTDPADYVLGQSTFFGTSSGLSATRMDTPVDVTSDGSDIFVADKENHRILVFRGFWASPASGKAADVVIGQVDMTSETPGRSATRMNDPSGVDVDPLGRLVVADENNHRVLVYADHTTLPSVNGAASAVIGQSSFTAGGIGGVAEDANGVTLAGGGVAWTRDGSVRLLDPVPVTGFITSAPNQIGIGSSGATLGQNRLDTPADVDAAAGSVWISNAEHARLMRWTDTTSPTITAAPTATVRCDGTVTVSWTTSESTTTQIRWDSVSRGSWAGGYANNYADPNFTGLTHSHELSFPTPGTYYARVRAEDWGYPASTTAVESGEISFVVPPTCPAPTTMLGDDVNAQAGTGRANPSTTSTPPIASTSFHTSWLQSAGVTMDAVEADTWSTPPEHAGGLWHLDSSPNAATESQTNNAFTWTGTQAFTTGKFGTAATFTADTQYGTAANAASTTKANDFTFDLWFRTSNISNHVYPILAIKSNNDCGGGADRCNYSIEFDRDLNLLCGYYTATTGALIQSCRTATGLVDGAWHHAAMTLTSTNQLQLYVDGLPAGAPVAGPAAARTGADPITIGAGTGGGNSFRGSIDEVRFSPTAYDAAAILGYFRTQRPHADRVWDGPVTALGANCTTATRCGDQTYAGAAEILREGARYWQRARFNTLNNDYWSTWGLDWLEVTNTTSINITVGGTIAFGSLLPGNDAFGTSTIEVNTNAPGGYQLLARDESDSWGLERVGGGPNVPDRQDGGTAPAIWPAATPGTFGLTVRSATGNRLPKWGTGPGGFAEDDVDDNLYTALENTTDVLLHERTTYSAGNDTILVTWRVNPALNQAPGSYDGVATVSAVANP